jgi:hypothetical protein
MGCRLMSFLIDGGEGGGGGAPGGCVGFSDSILTSCPEEFLIEIFFPGTKAPALALSDVGRVGGAEGVGGGEVTVGGG